MGCDSIYWEIDYSHYSYYPLVLSGPNGFCEGSSVRLNVQTDHYEIRLDGIEVEPGFTISKSGEYYLEAVDRNGCADSFVFFIEEYPSPEIFTQDYIGEFFESGRQLDVEYYGDPVTFKWTPRAGLDCYDCPYPVIESKWEGTYSIEAANEFDCIAKDTLQVRYKEIEIYIPNVIYGTAANPKNQVFFISSNFSFTYNLKIYDRWGNLLFEDTELNVNDHTRGWEPSTRFNPGVFTWLIEYELGGERNAIAGDITLLH
jgi:hypothetical protein